VRYITHIFFSFLLIFSLQTKAQLLDSLKEIIKSRSTIDLRIESRYSFINNELANISGFRIGVGFKRKLRLGGGISWLSSDLSQNVYLPNESNVLTSTPKYLRLGYVCIYADFVFYKTQRWQLSIPVQTGVGYAWYQFNYRYDMHSGPKNIFFIYEPGVSTQFKITRWVGLGFDVNYRFVLKNNRYVVDQFSSPTYAPKILFWVDQLFYELFPKTGLTKKYGPAVW
jgi:hypothetical protein